ncbi:four helix bundle protein [Petrimonas sp.]|uniref:four helix bundle protein n=1 Tax=Petrimonas sp. TaxID=2023866 RepID=UPI003F51232A
MAHNFKRLEIWKRGVDFVTEIYLLTRTYPKEELFGLAAQIRRAATSIPLNISEGAAKSSNKDFSRFLEMALGSCNEVETALIVSFNLQFIDSALFDEMQMKINELQKMIVKFKNSLK